ncbi:MAG: division/cell wall cluster transcriptional repressor MraZ [Gammaproteobacteria bacterium]|nr:division/cell wall cluster transcriptional repressor MraZ [Gammaproteobacteria bacterium]
MFRGSSSINLDAKGRLAVPSRYRQELEERCEGQMVITLDLHEPCLCLYPMQEWERIEAQISRIPSMRPEARSLQRLLVANAIDVELDGSGRLLIPPRMRAHAGLDKHVMLVGLSLKFQIWDEATWESRFEEDLDFIRQAELPEELQNLVL